MSELGRASWSMSMSRSWAGCATVAATGSMAATQPSIAPAIGTAPAAAPSATTMSTPPLMTTPTWPMPRSSPTSKPAPARGSSAALEGFFAAHQIAVQRVLTDNAMAYRHSRQVQAAVAELGAVGRFTRPYRPQTHGKVERFNRTLLAEWAYVRPYATNAEPTGALDSWLHLYNHHRAHTALGGHPPISRLNNPPNSYT